MDKEIDLRGLYCPTPILRTREEMDAAKLGDILIVIADDPAAEEDLKRWANRTGQKVLNIEKSGKELKVTIKKVK